MERINATHFIEQYNAVGVYKNQSTGFPKITQPLPISLLEEFLDDTAKMDTHRTVAVWKIKFKKKDHA